MLRDYAVAWRRGDAAIRAAYAGQGGGPLRLRALAAAAADTVAHIVGAYEYAAIDGRAAGDLPNPVVDDVGKFTLTLRRAPGGRWFLFSDMDNASRPPRRAGAAAAP